MKVGCQQCGASYSVADEKVAGRRLKLRCKKCGEPMVIDASARDSQPFGPTFQVITPDASDAPAAPVETEWFVGIEDQAQGPYTLEEVQSHYATGLIAPDTLVFREGLSAWTRAGDVAELQGQAGRTSSLLPPPPRPPSVPPSRARTFGGAAALDTEVPMGRDPFADSAPPQSPRVDAAELLAVGPQRDGTVQFSLDDIRALSAVSSPSSAPPPLKVGLAGGDDSGLIDMRSLAQAAAEQEAYRPIGSELQASPLDTMRPFALPIQVQRRGVDFRTKVLAGVASFGFLLAGGVGVLALTRAPQPQAAAVPGADQAPARASAAAVPSAPTPAPAAVVGAHTAADAKPAAAEAAREPAHAAEAAVEDRAVKGRRRAPRLQPRGDAPAPEKAAAKASKGTDIDDILAKSPPKSEPAAAKADKPSAAKGGDDLDALLLGAIDGKKSAPKPEAEAEQDAVPKTPSRNAVLSALGTAKAKTAKCKGTGVAMADITVANTGRVSSVSVSGVEGPAKSCVETAVRSTPFPKFQQPTFAVKFPFKLN
jgi:predicted Zn finger-like uncharacterized protein